MEDAKEGQGVLDAVAALEAEEDGEATFLFGGEDAGGGEAEAEVGRVALRICCVTASRSSKGTVGMGGGGVLGGIDPEGEELGGEVACAGGGQVDGASAKGACDEVPGLIQDALGGVGMSVYNEG